MKVKHLLILFGMFFCLTNIIAYSSWNIYLYKIYQYIPGKDKTGHFFIVGIMALLVNLHLHLASYKFGSFSIHKGTFLVALFMVGDELLQLTSVHRRFDWGDMCSNFAGAMFFGYLSPIIFSYFHSSNPSATGNLAEEEI